MFFPFGRNACFCVGASVLGFAALAATAAEEEPLELQSAIVRSLEHNPDLKAFAYELEAQSGRVRQAGARASPEVSLLVENALGTGAREGLDAAETTLSLAFVIEHGARERRIEAARAEGTVLDSESALRRLDVAAETTRRYLAVLTKQEELRELSKATALSQQTFEAVQARVRAAKAPEAEEARAYAQIARMRLEQEHTEHELATARRRLAALWGETQADFGAAQGDLMRLPTLEPFESVRERLDRNPQFERLVSERRLREAEMHLAESRRRPPWQVTAGVRRFEAESDHAFVVGLSVPLPVRDVVEGARATSRAQAAQVDAKREALRAQLDAELFALYQELGHSQTEYALLRDEVLPRMEKAVEQSRYAYERGRYGYVEWAAAQRELLDVRRALLEAAAKVHQFRIEIERLTGAALSVRI